MCQPLYCWLNSGCCWNCSVTFYQWVTWTFQLIDYNKNKVEGSLHGWKMALSDISNFQVFFLSVPKISQTTTLKPVHTDPLTPLLSELCKYEQTRERATLSRQGHHETTPSLLFSFYALTMHDKLRYWGDRKLRGLSVRSRCFHEATAIPKQFTSS